MISGITSFGKYTMLSSNIGIPYIATQANNPMQGMMRISGNNIQVFDGSNWISLGNNTCTVGLTLVAEELLDWARMKRDEELELAKLAETNTTIKDLLEQVKEKQNQLAMVKLLIKKEETVDSR